MGLVGGATTPWLLALLVISITAVAGEAVISNGGSGRSLLGFRETVHNVSFHCSPSGPCIPCEYSEKKDEKYRCSETGYRLPLKCVEESQNGSLEKSENKNLRRKLLPFQCVSNPCSVSPKRFVAAMKNFKLRKILENSSQLEGEKPSYITYRSCIPEESDEKLSVLGFEFGMVCMILFSGTVIYFRQKRRPILMSGLEITPFRF